jgi:hypothetical protein
MTNRRAGAAPRETNRGWADYTDPKSISKIESDRSFFNVRREVFNFGLMKTP